MRNFILGGSATSIIPGTLLAATMKAEDTTVIRRIIRTTTARP
jgi:hypothetical protein